MWVSALTSVDSVASMVYCLQRQKKSLPAAMARAEFLAVLKKADEVRLPTIYIQSASAFPH